MIRVILWDIDGTLLNFRMAEAAAVRKCFSIFGLGVCDDAMLREYSALNVRYWERLERGELAKSQILVMRFAEFFSRHDIDPTLAEDFNAEYQIRLGDTICFFDQALETVRALQGKMLQCAVTNGTKAAQDRKLKESGLDQLLDHIFISEVLGVEKPNAGFFDKVFECIGPYEKDEILIVGDSLTSDMRGGNNAGIRTCWFNPERIENGTKLRIDYEIRSIAEVRRIAGIE